MAQTLEVERLRQEMEQAAIDEDYEKAAALKSQLKSLEQGSIFEDFKSEVGEWLQGTGPDSDLVISSRVRTGPESRQLTFHLRCE